MTAPSVGDGIVGHRRRGCGAAGLAAALRRRSADVMRGQLGRPS
ncbi:hypothetical protein ACFCZV_07520 [Streptomyces hydrogenans]